MTRIALAFLALCTLTFSGCSDPDSPDPSSQEPNNANVQANDIPGDVVAPAGVVVTPAVAVAEPVVAVAEPAVVVPPPILPPPPPMPFVIPVGGGGGFGGSHGGGHHHDHHLRCGKAEAPECDGECPRGESCVEVDGDCECQRPARASITLDKTANVAVVPPAGSTIIYTFTVTNGPDELSNVRVNESAFSGAAAFPTITCNPSQPATLAPYEVMVCTASYVVQPGDVGDPLFNSATVIGVDCHGNTVADSDCHFIPGGGSPSITLVKSASAAILPPAGDTILYTFTAVNGPVALNDVVISDPSLPLLTCESPVGTPVVQPFDLPAGQVLQCTGNYITTEADLLAGFHTNIALVVGLDGLVVVDDTATLTIPASGPAPSIALVKTAVPTTFTVAGEIITYTLTATNGPVALTGVTISDPSLPVLTCESPVGTPVVQPFNLPANQVLECTGTYVINLNDVLAGEHTNTATVDGFDGIDLVTDSADLTILAVPAPSISLVKTALPTTFAAAGDIITYTLTATNGPVALDNVNISDPNLPVLSCESPIGTPIVLPLLTLPANQVIQCTADYTITAADVLAGFVTNIATASGDDGLITVFDTAGASVSLEDAIASITLTKSAVPDEFTAAGDLITYTLTATNGPVELANVIISDPSLPVLSCESPLGTPVVQPFNLLAGETLTCTGTYTITAADVLAGEHLNSAEVSGFDGLLEVTAQADLLIIAAPEAMIAISKIPEPTTFSAAGDLIEYSFFVTNGTVALTGVDIDDSDLLTLSCESPLGTPVVLPINLAAAQELFCTGTYVVTAADVLAGQHTNTVEVSGFNGLEEVTGSSGAFITFVAPVASITLVKTAAPDAFVAQDDEIVYTFTATNGPVALTNVTITDSDLLALVCESPVGTVVALPLANLPANQVLQCTGTYTTTIADVNAGLHTNTADVVGFNGLAQVTDSTDHTITLASVTITKAAEPDSFTAAGDLIEYTFTVTNGAVPVTGVDINDSDLLTLTCESPVGTAVVLPINMAAAQVLVCTGTYTITATDVTNGLHENTATVVGAAGPLVVTDQVELTITPAVASINISKSSAPLSFTAAGEEIDYTLTITNGPVDVTALVVTDLLLAGLTCTLDGLPFPLVPPPALAADDVVICTGTYITTLADVAAGEITNTAIVDATSPGGPILDSVDLTIPLQVGAR